MIIKNADVYTQDNVFVKGDVVVDKAHSPKCWKPLIMLTMKL